MFCWLVFLTDASQSVGTSQSWAQGILVRMAYIFQRGGSAGASYLMRLDRDQVCPPCSDILQTGLRRKTRARAVCQLLGQVFLEQSLTFYFWMPLVEVHSRCFHSGSLRPGDVLGVSLPTEEGAEPRGGWG